MYTMVQLTINNARGVTLCRVSLPANATMQQLLLQLSVVKPELRQARVIRNDARSVAHHLTSASTITTTTSGATPNAQTLLQAGLVGEDTTAETLVVLMADDAPAAASSTATDAPSSTDAVTARILDLFGRASASPPATVRPHASADPSAMDERQLALQRHLYAQIQQQQIDENLANALEYTPEVFAKVTMLYVPCTINQVPIKAFVDSGAQNSIMNKRTAERCGLMRLVDVRMRGVAVGVGQQEICGRIHMAPVNLAGLHMPFAFYVIEDQAMDLIIGLDQLRRHEMIIDLKQNCLTFDHVNVPFLPECQLPASAALDDDEKAMHGPRHQDEAVTATNPAVTASNPAAVTPTAESAPALSESERQARVQGFMAFSGMTDPTQAAELLEAADWDADAAAALFFDT
ncbi:DNA-damage inducible protein DDI1-like protein [Leishmania tarentolae]|uniref:DNA-damage inducible protein DDI1-like protein n=1 Tax=Leishmania tarentolae TaxID=5689 RepID=A0A640K6Y8_LEITA|nr:DNA-damage inducible protein DDI1-like protein [Leishmania tarentolae]